jgi:hypothetical protein
MRLTNRQHLERFQPKEKRPSTKPPGKAALKKATEIINRVIRRQAVANGYLDPNKPKFLWQYEHDGFIGWVEGNSKSDARGEIKKALGIPKNGRLPVGIKIMKSCPNPGSSMPIEAQVCKSTKQPSAA